MYTGVDLDVSRESYSFERMGYKQGIHGLCITVYSFDLRCESIALTFTLYYLITEHHNCNSQSKLISCTINIITAIHVNS